MKRTSMCGLVRAALFTAGAVLTLAATHSLAAQDVIEESSGGDIPGCGWGTKTLCRENTTCIGYGGNKKCTTTYEYFDPETN